MPAYAPEADHFGRRADREHAAVEHQQPVEPFVDAVEIVGRHDHRHPAGDQFAHDVAQRSSVFASTPVVGSSSSSSFGSCAIARATNTRCCCPPERFAIGRFAKCVHLDRFSACVDDLAIVLAERLPETSDARKRPIATTSQTVAGNDQSTASTCGT